MEISERYLEECELSENVEKIRDYVKSNPGVNAIELTGKMKNLGMNNANKAVIKFLKEKR